MHRKFLLSLWLMMLATNLFSGSFQQVWTHFAMADDAQKDYQWPSFIDSLKESLISESGFYVCDSCRSVSFLPVVNDSSKVVFAGVMPFQNRPSRLVWGLLLRSDSTVYIYNRDIDAAFHPVKPEIISSGHLFNDTDIIPLQIKYRQRLFVDIPDLQLKILFDELTTATADSVKDQLSETIWTRLQPLLSEHTLFSSVFTGLEKLSTLISKDGILKIVTWNVEYSDGRNVFHGGVVVRDPKKDILKVSRLNDNRSELRSPEMMTLTASKWYGAVYYDLVETHYKRKTYYTLLGYNANDAFSKIRVVDIISVSGNNRVSFGAPIFVDDRQTRRRLVFEYSIRANMMLRYNPKLKIIVMDHLAPSDPVFQNDRRYYGPDFTYDGLKFEKGKWILQKEIDVRNPSDNNR
ncbi:hypothetical protein ACT3CD_08845 [Geofilum sp. OHC36d9]|uniref:hypothetical protein n=1 Tax=Geofilum sp. OHC36d9 TaxID=3458413 RepID=UPI0040349D8A